MLINILLGLITIVVLLFLVTLVWQLFVRVPFVPTPAHISDAMIAMIPWKGNDVVIDLGAGDGRVLERMKKNQQGITAIGYEIVPTVWLLGFLRKIFFRSGVQLQLQSLFRADLSDADVVLVYLFPEVIRQLISKFERELRPGTYIVSHTFRLPGYTPIAQRRVARFGGEVSVFLYQWNASRAKQPDAKHQ